MVVVVFALHDDGLNPGFICREFIAAVSCAEWAVTADVTFGGSFGTAREAPLP